MKIDIYVGNPPYQEETGAGSIITGKKPVYHNFINLALDMDLRYICMIIPSRWTNGGIGLDHFRSRMESKGKHIRHIVDYMEWDIPVFESAMIAGGVMYFIYDGQYTGKCLYKNISKYNENEMYRSLIWKPTFIRNNKLLSVVLCVKSYNEVTMNNYCRYNAFGLESYERGDETGELRLLSSKEKSGISVQKIKCGIDLINQYKIAISGTTPGGGAVNKDGKYKVLALTTILKPLEVCTGTYIVLSNNWSLSQAEYILRYIRTKFVRALIQATISSMHITPYSFTYVPIPDFGIEPTDENLYRKYNLSQEDVEYIENSIKDWK